MALSGLDIFKKLPKMNCGDCGVPTCLAFAMKLAQSQAELSACPHVSPEAAAELAESSAPPIRGVVIGVGDSAFKIGEETVLFRHEKTFVNPPALAATVDAGADDATVDAVLAEAKASDFERVQMQLRIGCIAVRGNGDAERFREVAEKAAATQLPLVLMGSPAELEAAVAVVGNTRPLLHAATEETLDAMAALASANSCPLAVRAADLGTLASLAEKAAAAGVKDIVLDPAPSSAGVALRDLVFIRRAALKKSAAGLGYPVMLMTTDIAGDNEMLEAMIGSIGIMKYAGLIVLSRGEAWKTLPQLVLRQNIYTDPQRPMQVEQGIYEIGNPGPDAPFIVTTNFSLTYFIVSSEIESSRVPAYLGIVDSEGLSVLTAWAAGKFVPDRIAPFVTKSGIADKVSHREVIIPGLVAQISGELKENLDDWTVTVGPSEASELPVFLKRRAG